LERKPNDLTTIATLEQCYEARRMYQAALPLLDGLVAIRPPNEALAGDLRSWAEAERETCRQRLGPAPATTWRNLSELDQAVTACLATGRAASAAELLEQAEAPERAAWEVVDRMATLRLHLGEPERARALWRRAASVPQPGLALARIAACYLAEGDFLAARRAYHQAIEAQPDLFESRYGLAILEQDAGDAAAAYDQAVRALRVAPKDAASAAARVVAAVARFAPQHGRKPVSPPKFSLSP
jgi:tetratricopeptide (TPR) repeat protein